MMPPRRISQHLSRPGDEGTPPPSTQNLPPSQTLPNTAKGHEIEIFTEIKKLWQHCTPNFIDTSIGAVGSRQKIVFEKMV
jgi:hypothetical protein